MSTSTMPSRPTPDDSAGSAADLAQSKGSGLDAEGLYRLPFDLLARTSGRARRVVPSAKLSPGRLERNRYYIDLSRLDPQEVRNDLAVLTEALAMPSGARDELEQQLESFATVRFLGVGPSRGQMSYRIYLGFAAADESAVSIDWVPTDGSFLVKRYDELRAIPRDEELRILEECLLADRQDAADERAHEALSILARITEQAEHDFHVTRVAETTGPRRSAAFNYPYHPKSANRDIRDSLDGLARLFDIPTDEYEDWLHQTDELHLVDIAAGTAWNDEPFVTVYHGFVAEPPPYRPPEKAVAERSKPLRSVPNPLDRGVAAAATKQPPSRSPHRALPIGRIGLTFDSQARYESIAAASGGAPEDPKTLLPYLARMPSAAAALTFTLEVENVALFALQPVGPWAATTYRRLTLLWQQHQADPELRVALPGYTHGSKTISYPAGPRDLTLLQPELRGITELGACASPADILLERLEGGAGVTPEKRALHAAVLQLVHDPGALDALAKEGFVFDRAEVSPSPLERPGSDLWDTDFLFFHPLRRSRFARRICRLTLDIDDVVPASVRPIRSWSIY